MKPVLHVYDSYQNWIHAIVRANIGMGKPLHIVELQRGKNIPDGYLFARLSMKPQILEAEKMWLCRNAGPGLKCVTDWSQLMAYEDKSLQTRWWGSMMPRTELVSNADEYTSAMHDLGLPIVSKAAVGASSQHVRLHYNWRGLEDERDALFYGDGIQLDGSFGIQKGYAILQEFLPGNDFTWRVNRVGNEFAVFKRYNYEDKPVAQTGNTTAVREITPDVREVLDFAEDVSAAIESKWVALDILRDASGELRLIETSLGWPYPGVGEGALWFPSNRPWTDMFEIMIQGIIDGDFDS